MKSGKRFITFIAALFAVLFIVFLYRNATAPAYTELQFEDVDGEIHHFSDYAGKPILMIFWATDCPACVQELPELIALHEEYAAKGLVMLGVSLPHDTPSHIKAMREARGLPYTLVWDSEGEISRAFNNVRVTPTHYLISPEGKIVMRKIGVLDKESVSTQLDRMGLS
ncbi:peroxiredoxin [Methylophaga sp.]|uniref:peroxiredoxin family protein n=1 Tax=Methylophaga sp. TaxID=2024840 RepID=UPI002717A330|nr:TlpA disulfide reductase family protein [Methylophaga sp.]MDO8826080.1 TlpA disulfide reductase family protein [Methylophaga sp.]